MYNGSFDEPLAGFIAKRQKEGQEFNLDELLLLSYLRNHTEIDVTTAAKLCQRSDEKIRDILEGLAVQRGTWLERRGKKKGVTYHLSRSAASELLGKVAYTRTRDIDAVRYPELIRAYVQQHGFINNRDCRELLGLGSSITAKVKASRLLSRCEFLERFGQKRGTQYRLKSNLNVK